MRHVVLSIVLIGAVGSIAAAAAAPAPSPLPSVLSALRARGLPMTPSGMVRQPFFAPRARVYANPGGDVHTWLFESERRARAAAAGISKDGSTIRSGGKVSNVHWIGPPHWFRLRRLLVLYAGADAKTITALRSVLGAQFAGR